jgi:transposase
MLKITNPTVRRDQVGAVFRRCHDARLWKRYHSILRLLNEKSCCEIAQWLYRDEEAIRNWMQAINEAGLPGLERDPIPGRPM